jgi:dihydrofolate reductase
LIDEYVVQVYPLVLGEGRHLFTGGSPFTKLRLVDSVNTNTGVIIATYHPAG